MTCPFNCVCGLTSVQGPMSESLESPPSRTTGADVMPAPQALQTATSLTPRRILCGSSASSHCEHANSEGIRGDNTPIAIQTAKAVNKLIKKILSAAISLETTPYRWYLFKLPSSHAYPSQEGCDRHPAKKQQCSNVHL